MMLCTVIIRMSVIRVSEVAEQIFRELELKFNLPTVVLLQCPPAEPGSFSPWSVQV